MPWHEFYVDATLEGDGLGFGFNVGALCDITPKLKMGLSYRSEGSIPLDGKVKQTLILPCSPAMQAANPATAHLFAGGSLEAEPDATADFPLPADAGIGFAWNPQDRLTLALDVVWTNWAAIKDVTIDLDGNGPTGAPAEDSKLVLRYEDTYRFNVGGADDLGLYGAHGVFAGALQQAGMPPEVNITFTPFSDDAGGTVPADHTKQTYERLKVLLKWHNQKFQE